MRQGMSWAPLSCVYTCALSPFPRPLWGDDTAKAPTGGAPLSLDFPTLKIREPKEHLLITNCPLYGDLVQ